MKLVLNRKSEWLNRLKNFKVLIDGKEIGMIANGKVEEYELPAGQHTIECKIMWYYSNKYAFDSADSSIVYLEVKNGMKGFWIMYALLFVFVIFNTISPSTVDSFGHNGRWIRLGLPLIVLLYFVYYLTLGRRQYLKIDKDSSNVFA